MQNFGEDEDEVWLQSILSPMPLAPQPLSGCHTDPLFAHQEIFTTEILDQEAFTLELFFDSRFIKDVGPIQPQKYI